MTVYFKQNIPKEQWDDLYKVFGKYKQFPKNYMECLISIIGNKLIYCDMSYDKYTIIVTNEDLKYLKLLVSLDGVQELRLPDKYFDGTLALLEYIDSKNTSFVDIENFLRHSLIPTNLRKSNKDIFRVMSIDNWKGVFNQSNPKMSTSRYFSSWSTSLKSAKNFYNDVYRNTTDKCIIIKKPFIQHDCMLNVREYLRYYRLQDWSIYVEREDEVFMKNSDFYTIINPDKDIIWKNYN
jgi:hypothetical protein